MLIYRYALTPVPALCGVIPGSDRDLTQSPLTPAEEPIIEWVRQTLPAAQKQLRRHGMAFDKDLWEAWKPYHTAEQAVQDGKIASHNVPRPEYVAYRGNWYECLDCKARDSRYAMRLAWEHGHGIMTGERREYIETRFDPTKWQRGQQGADVDTKRAITIYTGFLCPDCECARLAAKLERERAIMSGKSVQLGEWMNPEQEIPA